MDLLQKDTASDTSAIDMIEVVSGVYLGSKRAAKDRQKQRSCRVRSIVNATPSRDEDAVRGLPNYFEKTSGTVYLRIPVLENDDLLEHLDDACDFISSRLAYGSVLVHCERGISASPAIVAAYLMRSMRISYDQALAIIRSKRPQAQPNDTYVQQLLEYDKSLGPKNDAKDNRNSKTRKLDASNLSETSKRPRVDSPRDEEK